MEINGKKKLAKTLDNYVFTTLKITLALALLTGLVCYLTNNSFVWVIIILQLGLTACLIFTMVKGGTTGKLYAQGAKSRRKKYLPIFYKPNNHHSKIEILPYLHSK